MFEMNAAPAPASQGHGPRQAAVRRAFPAGGLPAAARRSGDFPRG